MIIRLSEEVHVCSGYNLSNMGTGLQQNAVKEPC